MKEDLQIQVVPPTGIYFTWQLWSGSLPNDTVPQNDHLNLSTVSGSLLVSGWWIFTSSMYRWRTASRSAVAGRPRTARWATWRVRLPLPELWHRRTTRPARQREDDRRQCRKIRGIAIVKLSSMYTSERFSLSDKRSWCEISINLFIILSFPIN